MTNKPAGPDLVVWSKEFSIDLPEVDEQHQVLVERINLLWRALMANRDEEVIARLLEDLHDYTETHFIAEESLMRSVGYPELEAHQRSHRQFVAHIREAATAHDQGRHIGMELLKFLNDWLINHIKVTDRHYADFARGRMQGGITSRFASLYRSFNGLIGRAGQARADAQEMEGLDMKTTIDAHVEWLHRLRDYVDGKESLEYNVGDVAKEDLCLLGTWIKLHEAQGWGRYPEFQTLIEVHRAFHRTAAEVVAWRQSGDLRAANQTLRGDLRQRSNEVRFEIIRLYSAVHG